MTTEENTVAAPLRCVIVVDKELPLGLLANASAVIALSIGQRYPGFVGDGWTDSAGADHAGLVTTGVAILGATQADLSNIRQRGAASGLDVIDFPVAGQQTTNYQAFRETVASTPAEELAYLGVALIGQKKQVNKIVGNLGLLR